MFFAKKNMTQKIKKWKKSRKNTKKKNPPPILYYTNVLLHYFVTNFETKKFVFGAKISVLRVQVVNYEPLLKPML